MIYLTSSNESAISTAQAVISLNCKLPNSVGTIKWADISKAANQDLWFIEKPDLKGWGNNEHFTQEQMMRGVDLVDIIELERNEAWFSVLEV